jgi:signal transduction histidine kinase
LSVLNLVAILLACATLTLFILFRTRYALAELSLLDFLQLRTLLRSGDPVGTQVLLEEVRPELAAALIFSVVLALGFAVALARYLAGAFNRFTLSLHQLARGDYSARARLGGAPLEVARLGDEFNRMAERLEHLERERQFESASIAHDLRTPITAMRLRVLGVIDGVHDLTPEALEPLLGQLGTLERLADDLQTLTLHDAGHLSLNLERLEVAPLFAALEREFGGVAHAAGVRLETVVAAGVAVRADAHRLRQALGNLVQNAVTHAGHGGVARLTAVQTSSQVCFSVADSGSGVNEDQLEHLFERFYRVDASRSKALGGSGLGLAIVRAIAEAHGGAVTAARGELGGLEVRLCLPAR